MSLSSFWKVFWFRYLGITAALILGAGVVSAQITRTWNGTVSSDWFNATNWIPNGVPAANDIVNFTNANGTINLTSPVTISNQFNWSGGTVMGNGMTIASNGLLTISGTATLHLQNALTNAGTVAMTNTGFLDVPNNESTYFGLIENLSGALWDIQNDQSLFNDAGTNASFYNAGTLRKSASSNGTTVISIPIINTGNVTALQGTLNFNGGGPLTGTFTATNPASIIFSGGNFSNSVPVVINGPGSVEFTGGNLTLLTDVITNLPLVGGTLYLGPAFQGGTITNLTIAGTMTLAGTNTVTGTFNWNNGYIAGGPLTIASNGEMNINGTTTLYLESPLTNAGTVTWSNTGDLDVLNGSGIYFGEIENLAGALWDIQNDRNLGNNAGTTANFYNAGMLRKSASSNGTTTVSIPIINSGDVTALQGTLNFNGGGPLTGTFTATNPASIIFSGGNFSNSVPVVINGPGSVEFTGGNLTLLTDVITNLPLVGGTLYLGPAFQGGTITNLTIAGTMTLAGTNTVTGTFNWNNGYIAGGPLTIASNGEMNINGTTTLYLESPLTNAGTVTWSNTGDLDVLNGSGIYFGEIENLAGALWDIQNDQNLGNNAGTTANFYNTGMLRKSASSNGTTTVSIPIINSGNVTALQGTLNFNGGGPLTGTFTATNPASIIFSDGNFSNSVPVMINGLGSVEFTGGNLTLLTDVITNLSLVGGTVNLGPAFQGGTITNLTIAGTMTLAGANTVTGTFNWNNGYIAGGPLTIASNGVMNINGTTTLYLESPLTNAGTVTWSNTGDLDVLNGSGIYFGEIENLAGALWDIQNDQNLGNNAGTTANFYNTGMLRKSASSNGTTTVSIPIINSGNVTALQGTLNFNGGGPLTGTFTATNPASIIFSGSNFSNSVPVVINGLGSVEFTGGNLTLLTDVITNLSLVGGTVNLGPAFQGGTITNLTIAGTATLAGTNTVTGMFNWNDGYIAGGPLTIASNGVMNINGTTTLYLESPLTNFGTVTWTNAAGSFDSLDVLNNNGAPYAGLIENLSGGLFDIQCDQSLFNNAGTNAYFYNAGTLQKSGQTATTTITIPVTNNAGTITVLQGNIAFNDGFMPIGGKLLFGLTSATDFGTMNISGNATLVGSIGVLWLNGFVPAFGNSFTLLTYGLYNGIFTNFTSPPGAIWNTNYTSTSFIASVASINQLVFTTQPASGILTNTILAPIVVQVEDPGNNPVAISGVPITVSLNSGSGVVNGTLAQNTDSSGKATFGNLNFNAAGAKTLRAASSGLTSAISVPFQILPLIGLQLTNTGALIQLNGSNTLGPVMIYASTNLGNPLAWIPIYTNAPTNGSIQFLDSLATNYPARFYRFTGP